MTEFVFHNSEQFTGKSLLKAQESELAAICRQELGGFNYAAYYLQENADGRYYA